MFRKMRRFKQQISNEKCVELLKKEPRGVLSVLGDDDYPYGLPINFYYDEEDKKIYFHGAKEGHKMDAIRRHNKASLCIYDQGFKREGEWPLNINSVIVFGKITLVEDMEKVTDKVRFLGLKHYPTPESVEEEIAKAISRVQLFEMSIDHMTGKLVNES